MKGTTHRIMITKLRRHAHFLATERDKYTRQIEPTVKFLCKNCDKNRKEDVHHWLFDCIWSKILQPRANLLNTIVRFLGYLPNDQEFIHKLMNCDFHKLPTKQTELISKLTYIMYNIRGKTTQQTATILPPLHGPCI